MKCKCDYEMEFLIIDEYGDSYNWCPMCGRIFNSWYSKQTKLSVFEWKEPILRNPMIEEEIK